MERIRVLVAQALDLGVDSFVGAALRALMELAEGMAGLLNQRANVDMEIFAVEAELEFCAVEAEARKAELEDELRSLTGRRAQVDRELALVRQRYNAWRVNPVF